MPTYNSILFDPPAPTVRVVIRHPTSRKALSEINVLLDSGADATLIPQDAVNKLGVDFISGKSYELRGFDGSPSFAQAAELELIFMNRVFKGLFLLVDQEWGILGRDVLNHISLLLDGPNLTWAIQSSTTSSSRT
ncbi:MAG: retropepsin-like aspartic protease [bacterium]